MKSRMLGLVVVMLAVHVIGCSEEEVKTYVYGKLRCDECGSTEGFQVDGSLAKGGEKYYGFCTESGGDFEFVVGSRDKASAELNSDFYFQFKGIKGPPSSGVYKKGKEPKNDEDLYTKFESGFVKNVISWSFSLDDVEEPADELCYVQLYATPDSNELTPTDQPFDYFVKIECHGLEKEDSSSSGVMLNDVELELWFDNC